MSFNYILRHFFIFLFLLSTFFSYAQNIEFNKENFKNDKEGLKVAIKNLKEGDYKYEVGTFMYSQALPYYLNAYAFNPNNAELNYKIGNCYLYSSNKLKSLPHLEKAYKLDPQVDPEINYSLGRAYQLNMDWEKAIKEYKTYQIKLTGENATEYRKAVMKKIAECNSGIELTKKPVRVFIDNLGKEINSQYAEYGPSISADESTIIFTSKRDATTGGLMDTEINQYFEDIYISSKENDKWTLAKNIGPPINTEGHDATVGLSPDGQKLLIYIDDGLKGNGNIYICTLKGSTWSSPKKLNKNINTDYKESSASISYDGKQIYFVSDKPGGRGDRDIYVSTQDKKGDWGLAVNIGPTINTEYGEEGIFMHPDGKTLYFSSQGHNSMGGYDIFKSVYEKGKWSAPINMGYPINSADDDVFFVMSASGKHGYYSSIKSDGMGEKDLYMITFLGAEKTPLLSNEDKLLASATQAVEEAIVASAVEIKTAQLTILKGTITDAISHKPLEASIELVDNQKNEVIANFTSNSVSGKYLVSLPAGKNYGIAVKADGYLFHSQNFDIPASSAFQEVIKDIELGKLEVGSKIVLNNIFFDFDQATLRSESTNELERLTSLMNEMPSLVIEISGHTDNKGTVAYNQVLSENRAKAVVDYLVSKGIDKKRMQYKGLGFSQPVASNDTDEGRQQNRRTEFKIISK